MHGLDFIGANARIYAFCLPVSTCALTLLRPLHLSLSKIDTHTRIRTVTHTITHTHTHKHTHTHTHERTRTHTITHT